MFTPKLKRIGFIFLLLLSGLLVGCREEETNSAETAVSATPAATPDPEAAPPPTIDDITPPDKVRQALDQIVTDFLLFLPKLLSALVLFIITLYLAGLISRIVRRIMERRRADAGVTLLVYHVTRWGIIILGTISALRQVDFEVTAFLAGLGILGFTIGFALQDISQNVVAGLLLLIQKPFELGDMIRVEDYTGTVLSVDLRSTELRTRDGHNVLIPNASVFTTPIINYSRQATWRIEISIGVAYDSDLEKVQQITLEAIRALPDVLSNPAPNLFFRAFDDSSINYALHYWIDGRITDPFTATHPAIIAIQRAYAQSDIEIPYPIQTEIQVDATTPRGGNAQNG